MDADDPEQDFVEDAAEVFDFLSEYFEDVETGGAHPLEHYLKRFPGCEEAVRREYQSQSEGAAAPPEVTVASRVGPYELISEIGRGGQGVVYLAEDTRIARRVALKVLPPAALFLSEDRRRRLRREAEVISRLAHPGICGIFDAEIGEELAYIAMPLVEGQTLASAIASQRDAHNEQEPSPVPLNPRTEAASMPLLAFFESAARALHSAHEAGIVHRDIKPGNLMVTPEGQPVWLDFGQARDAQSQIADLTMSGEIFGTPAYMAPEQISGGQVDARTDVWALAVSLFEALCLRRPFEKSSVHALMLSIQQDDPLNLRELNPYVGEELAVVVATGLEHDMQRRYSSALAFAEDLARIQRREPIQAQPAGRALRMRRWVERHPVLTVAIVAMVASLIVVSGLLVETRRAHGLKTAALDEALDANLQKDVALEQKDAALEVALGRHLAERAEALLDEDQASALILAIQAVQKAPNSLTREALFSALENCQLRMVYEAGHQQIFFDVQLVPGNQWVAALRLDGMVVLFDRVSGEERQSWPAHDPREDATGAQAVLRASLDGRWVASGGMDGRVCLKQIGAQDEARLFDGPGGPIARVLFSTLAETLLVQTQTGKSAVYRVADGALVSELETQHELAHEASSDTFFELWSHEDFMRQPMCWEARSGERSTSQIALGLSASWYHKIGEEWAYLERGQLATGDAQRSPLTVLPADAGVRWAEVSLSGEQFLFAASAPHEGLLRYADLSTGRVDSFALPFEGDPLAVRFSHDGTRLALLDNKGGLFLMDTADWAVVAEGRGYFRPEFLAWSEDDDFLLTRQRIGPQAQLCFGTPRPDVYTLRCGASPVRQVSFAPDGERALTITEAGALRVWSTPTDSAFEAGKLLATLTPPARGIRGATFESTGAGVFAWGAAGIDFWKGPQYLHTVERPSARPLVHAALLPGELRWLALDDRGQAWLDAPHWKAPQALAAELAPVVLLQPTPGGERFVTAHADGTVRLWDTQTLDEVWSAQLGSASAQPLVLGDLCFDPRGELLAVTCSERLVHFLRLSDGGEARETLGVFAPAQLDWSADGRRVVVVGEQGRGALRIEDLEPAEPRDHVMRTEDFHGDDLTAGAFNGDGTLLLSGSLDGTVMVRDVRGIPDPRSTILIAHLRGRGGAVRSACFSAGDGPARVIAGFEDGTAQIWPVDPLPPAIARRPREKLRDWEYAREQRFAKPLDYR